MPAKPICTVQITCHAEPRAFDKPPFLSDAYLRDRSESTQLLFCKKARSVSKKGWLCQQSLCAAASHCLCCWPEASTGDFPECALILGIQKFTVPSPSTSRLCAVAFLETRASFLSAPGAEPAWAQQLFFSSIRWGTRGWSSGLVRWLWFHLPDMCK